MNHQHAAAAVACERTSIPLETHLEFGIKEQFRYTFSSPYTEYNRIFSVIFFSGHFLLLLEIATNGSEVFHHRIENENQ